MLYWAVFVLLLYHLYGRLITIIFICKNNVCPSSLWQGYIVNINALFEHFLCAWKLARYVLLTICDHVHMRTRSQGLSTASSDGVLNPVPTPRIRTPTSDGLSPNYSLQRPASVIVRLMDCMSTSSTLREDRGISSQDYLLSTYVPTPRARAASTLDTCSIDW